MWVKHGNLKYKSIILVQNNSGEIGKTSRNRHCEFKAGNQKQSVLRTEDSQPCHRHRGGVPEGVQVDESGTGERARLQGKPQVYPWPSPMKVTFCFVYWNLPKWMNILLGVEVRMMVCFHIMYECRDFIKSVS